MGTRLEIRRFFEIGENSVKVEFSEAVLKAFLREEERQNRQIGQWCRYAKAELSEMVRKALEELGNERSQDGA